MRQEAELGEVREEGNGRGEGIGEAEGGEAELNDVGGGGD